MTPFLIICSIGCTLGNLMHDSGPDYAFVDLSNVLEHKTRHKRQTDEAPCDLKEKLSLPISYKNHKKTLQLKKNKRFSPENIPLLIQDEVGYLVKKKKVKKNEVTALYYYEEDGLRFPVMVKCRFKKDCSSSRCEIKGDLLTKDELIEIAGSAAEKKAEYDKSIHKVPHNVKYLPGFEDTGTDDTRIPGLDPEGFPDDELPPVLKASKKLKMEDILSKEALRKIAKEKKKNKGKRQKRQTEEQLFDEREHVLDLLMTNDFQFFQKFKNLDGIEKTEEEALDFMLEKQAHYAFSIDMYMYNIRRDAPDIKIRVHLNAIIPVMAHEDAAVWSENPIKYTDTEIHLDADKALDDLAKYVYNNSYLMLNVDHVMAFTGQDLVRNNSGDLQRQVKGYTYVNNIEGIICKQPWYAVSIIESPAIGFVARTAAHELAHNMRCGHDITPGCSTEEQFVMSPNFNIATYKYRTNPYKFSPCCIESIRAHLKNLSAMISNETTFEHRYECLNHHSAKDDFSYLDRSILPGQRYTLNDQCRYLLNDPNSFLCGKPIPTYCWGLVYCFSQDGFCYGMYGYNGSPCNVTSICYYGNCVLNELIPTITSTEAANTTEFTTIESTTEEQTTTGVTELITTTEEVTTVETELTTTTEKVTTVEIELTTTPEKVTTVETELTTLSEEVTSVETELTTTTETSPPPEFTTETESTEEVTPSATELTTTTEDANLPQWSHWTLCRKNCVRLRFRYCGYMEKTCKRRVKQYEACTNDYCQEDTAKTIKALKGKGKRKDEGKSKGKDEDEDEDKRKDKDKSKGKGNRKDENKSKGKDGNEGKGKRKDKGKSKGKGKGKR